MAKSKSQKRMEKEIKNMHPVTLLIGVVFLVMGIIVGYLACNFVSQDDTFELVGDKTINIALNADTRYVDAGVECVSFGRDLADKVVVKTNMTKNTDGSYTIDTTQEGEYYIIYTVDDIKYKDIQRVRVITIGGTNE